METHITFLTNRDFQALMCSILHIIYVNDGKHFLPDTDHTRTLGRAFDHLTDQALDIYGDTETGEVIYELNRGIVNDVLSNENVDAEISKLENTLKDMIAFRNSKKAIINSITA